MLLPKGNGSQSPKVRVTPQQQKVNKPLASEVSETADPLPQIAINTHSNPKAEVRGSGRSKGENTATSPRGPHATRVPAVRSWSPIWYAQHLRDQSSEQAIALLCITVHPKHYLEATHQVLHELNKLTVEEAATAIHELHGPKRYIRGTGNSMFLPVSLTTIDDCRSIATCALLDSGCMGSSINAGFVQAKGLNMHKLARPVPVYNADGSLNNGGSITDYVVLQLAIGQHVERITFGVTNLGSSNI
ncbi:hypothetical protein DEU56DRAFT_748177, partial [Suillus clintonianus]|uniref:uncharacterized protein n=1 Tax=Suillus clintonianus TaxID=1904413 RepID=UPI001B8679D0